MKLKLKLRPATLLFLSCAAVLLPFSAGGAAESGAALVVNSAAGKAGDTVGVTVSLRGIKNLAGVKGLAGGEFELHYDPAAASIKKIKKGSVVDSSFLFVENKNYSESSAKVTLAAATGLIDSDGDLCHVTFTLKKDGPVKVELKEIAFYDQDVRPLTVGASSELPEASPGEGALAGGGGGTAVELRSPGDAAPPSSSHPDAAASSGEHSGETGAAEAPPGDGPAGDAPASRKNKAAESSPAETGRRWLLPVAIMLTVAAAGTGAAYVYRCRSREKKL